MLAHLDRKLLRDLARNKGQAVAVAVVMACGLAMMIMARSLIHSLETTRAGYYPKFHGCEAVFTFFRLRPDVTR